MKGYVSSLAKAFLFIAILSVSLFSGASDVWAQEREPCIVETNIHSRQGKDVTAFLAEGWTIDQQVAGDLFGSSKKDVALIVKWQKEERSHGALLLIKRLEDGSYYLHSFSCDVIALGGMMLYGSKLDIKKNVLSVTSEYGSRTYYTTTLRFRYDPTEDKFLLIGKDENTHDRVGSEGDTNVSVNYLTGVMTENGRKIKAREETKFLNNVDYTGEHY